MIYLDILFLLRVHSLGLSQADIPAQSSGSEMVALDSVGLTPLLERSKGSPEFSVALILSEALDSAAGRGVIPVAAAAWVTAAIAFLWSTLPALKAGELRFALTNQSPHRPWLIPPLLNAWSASQALANTGALPR